MALLPTVGKPLPDSSQSTARAIWLAGSDEMLNKNKDVESLQISTHRHEMMVNKYNESCPPEGTSSVNVLPCRGHPCSLPTVLVLESGHPPRCSHRVAKR